MGLCHSDQKQVLRMQNQQLVVDVSKVQKDLNLQILTVDQVKQAFEKKDKTRKENVLSLQENMNTMKLTMENQEISIQDLDTKNVILTQRNKELELELKEVQEKFIIQEKNKQEIATQLLATEAALNKRKVSRRFSFGSRAN